MPPPLPPRPPPTLSPTPAPAPKKSWWSRNWKWMLPTLAALGLATFIGIIFAFIAGIAATVKKSDAYRHPVALVKTHPAVINALGAPITEGLLPTGNIHLNNSNGEANLEVTLKGPKGKATLYIEAQKQRGAWRYDHVEVHLPNTATPLDLTQQANAPDTVEF